MGTHIEEIAVRTTRREEIVDVTREVAAAVRRTGVETGVAFIYSPHTTGGVTIQENADPDVPADILEHLRSLVPHASRFRHAEGNADAHIKTCLVGCSQAVPIEAGELRLGTWQAVFFCEFDGPRSRKLMVKVVPG